MAWATQEPHFYIFQGYYRKMRQNSPKCVVYRSGGPPYFIHDIFWKKLYTGGQTHILAYGKLNILIIKKLQQYQYA